MWIVFIVNGIHMHILIGHTMAYGSLKQFLKSERKKRHETGTNEVGGENY